MNIRTKLAAAAVALTLSIPVALAAQATPADKPERHARAGKRAHRGDGHLLGRARALNLTDQQKEFARQLMTDTRNQAKPIAEQLRQNRKELAEAVKSNDAAAIDQITQRQAPLIAQLSALRSKAMASFYAQLTPEQKTKADEFRAKGRKRGARWQNRG